VNRAQDRSTPFAVNSAAYWDRRFDEDWDAFGGPQQTEYFARLLVKALPPDLRAWMSGNCASILDWGCATGEAANVLHAVFPTAAVTGLDFSSSAVKQAAQKFPAVRFISESLDALGEDFDIVTTSNTLEHFADPWSVAAQLAQRARHLVLVLVPFREPEEARIAEHVVSFAPFDLPLALAKTQLLHYSVHTTDPHFWPGRQLLLVYASEQVWNANRRRRHLDASIRQHLTPDDCPEILQKRDELPTIDAGNPTIGGYVLERDLLGWQRRRD
jgi:ubiquinone/menaquinone biosynthesis C-methylase UbiE